MNSKLLDQKMGLIQWLTTLEDQATIDKLIRFRKEETKDWWDMISEEEKNSIKKGISDADENKLNPHSTAKNLYEKWL